MRHIRKRLTYANVMSSIAVFIVLGGAAYAASQLPKNSVGTKQLKKNAVTAAKIKKNAVTTAKIKKSAVNGSKIADGSVTGTDINASSTSFSQVVARIRGNAQLPFTGGQVYPFNSPTYTQPAGMDIQAIGALDVTFDAACTQPRSASAYLLVNAKNPSTPTPFDMAGSGTVLDEGTGTVTRLIDFVPFPGTYASLNRVAPNAPQKLTFSVFLTSGSCNSGSGITATGGSVDLIGTK